MAGMDPAQAVANALGWFEVNSGWAPPDPDVLAEWMDDGVCRCPDECLVAPDEWCEHGLASWWLILTELDPLAIPNKGRLDRDRQDFRAIAAAHGAACRAGHDTYVDPSTGYQVMTARSLWDRGHCCDSGCRHCPYR